MKGRFPELRQFFAYLNEDWPDDYGTPERAVLTAIREYRREHLRPVLRELDALIAMGLPESELRKVAYYELGANYDPTQGDNPFTYLHWLLWVRAEVSKALGEDPIM